MKIKSTYKLTDRYSINEIIDDMCTVTIVDLKSEKEIENKDEEGNVTITYEYDCVEMKLIHNENYIKNHLDDLYAKGVIAEKNRTVDVSVQARLEALEEAVLEIAGE